MKNNALNNNHSVRKNLANKEGLSRWEINNAYAKRNNDIKDGYYTGKPKIPKGQCR